MNLLARLNATPVTMKQKIHLYRLGICPRITWNLTIFDFPLSWLEKTLDLIATKHLKQWIGLAQPADPSQLYLPQASGSRAGALINIYILQEDAGWESSPVDDI